MAIIQDILSLTCQVLNKISLNANFLSAQENNKLKNQQMDQLENKPLEGLDFRENQQQRNKRLRIAFIFLVGFFLGIAIKSQLFKLVTIGFEDYKLANLKSNIDLNKDPVPTVAADETNKETGTNQEEATPDDGSTSATVPSGGSCGN